MRLHYKEQPVDGVQANNGCFLSEWKHINILRQEFSAFVVKAGGEYSYHCMLMSQ
jgi:hypothetical protein